MRAHGDGAEGGKKVRLVIVNVVMGTHRDKEGVNGRLQLRCASVF